MSKYSDALRERIKKNQDNREGTTSLFLDLSGFEDVKIFKPKDGRNFLYIIPYVVSTKHHPQGIEKGNVDYLLDVWVHKRIGYGNEAIICPLMNFKKPCPICEEVDKLREEDPESKIAAGLKASRRTVYNVVDEKNPDDGIQLFFTNHFFFEKELLDASANSETGDGLIPFSDPSAGYVIKFRAVEETYQKAKFFKFKDFDFKKTEDAFDDDIVEEAFPLDKMMILRTYEEIQKIFYSGEGSSEDEEDKEDEPSEKRESKKSLFKKRKEDEDKNDKEDRKSKKDDDEEEEEKPKKKKEEKVTECPSGYKFGVECDKHPECKKCDVWEDCADAHDEMKKG